MYDIVLTIEDVFGLNPSEAKDKAITMLLHWDVERDDLDVFCHQIGGKRKKV